MIFHFSFKAPFDKKVQGFVVVVVEVADDDDDHDGDHDDDDDSGKKSISTKRRGIKKFFVTRQKSSLRVFKHAC